MQYDQLRLKTSLFSAALMMAASSFANSEDPLPVVIYPQQESSVDARYNYPLALLKLCETRTGKFQLKPSEFKATQGRYLRLIEKNKGLDIAFGLTDLDREKRFLPIRIPIDRGLFGWRLLLIRHHNQGTFDVIDNSTELGQLNAVLGHDWPDVEIFKANSMLVSTGSEYMGLFKMLARDHADYFPRAVSEVWDEEISNADLGLVVENHLVVYYQTAAYFFVHKENKPLAEVLTGCLDKAIEDGSFKRLFDDYFGEAIKKSDLHNRRLIKLNNPDLPPLTPIHNKQYWFSPDE